jgi:hypothetical protein
MTRYSAGYKGPMLPAAGPRVSAQTAGTPAGTLSPRGAMTGGGRPAPTRPMSTAPTRPMSTGPSPSPRGAMTGGGRPAPTSPMKKGGAIAKKKTAPKKR